MYLKNAGESTSKQIKICQQYPEYDSKAFDGETSVLELWGIWSTTLLPLLSSPLWLRVEVSLGQTELLFNHLTMCKQMANVKLNS